MVCFENILKRIIDRLLKNHQGSVPVNFTNKIKRDAQNRQRNTNIHKNYGVRPETREAEMQNMIQIEKRVKEKE